MPGLSSTIRTAAPFCTTPGRTSSARASGWPGSICRFGCMPTASAGPAHHLAADQRRRARAPCARPRHAARCRRAAGGGDRHLHRIVHPAGEAQMDRFHRLAGHRQHGGEPAGIGVIVELGHHRPRIGLRPAPAGARSQPARRRSRPTRHRRSARPARRPTHRRARSGLPGRSSTARSADEAGRQSTPNCRAMAPSCAASTTMRPPGPGPGPSTRSALAPGIVEQVRQPHRPARAAWSSCAASPPRRGARQAERQIRRVQSSA